MKKQIYEIDENGYIVEIYVKEFNEEENPIEELTENIVTKSPPNGLYRARWVNGEWVEDMTQEEIDALNNQPRELTKEELLEQRVNGQDQVIEELMFVILPELLGGGM